MEMLSFPQAAELLVKLEDEGNARVAKKARRGA